MENKKIFMGIDEGTNSVGWAVTSDDYKVIKKNGKALWGAYLFDEAETQITRRTKRSSRRRIQRRKWRILLLQELFKNEIDKVDPNFFRKLESSFCKLEDKDSNSKYNLFTDLTYNDADYYKQYPTIYHLRDALIKEDRKFDIRLVYLALHHMIKYRGHFTFENESYNVSDSNFKEMLEQINNCINNDKEKFNVEIVNENQLYDILTSNKTRSDRKKCLCDYFNLDKKSSLNNIISLLCGLGVKPKDLFGDADIEVEGVSKIDFNSSKLDEELPKLESVVGDNIDLVYAAKNMYDSAVLKRLLGKATSISSAMIERYNKHSADLKELKAYVMDKHPEKYSKIFRDTSEANKNNYAHYVGSNMSSGKKESLKHANYDEFCKFLNSELPELKTESSEYTKRVLFDIDNKNYLPRLNTTDNGVFPYQLNLNEMVQILKNQAKYYPFLQENDKYGTVTEKIISLLKFRIPYYVGPLNPNSKFAWIQKKEKGKIYPWNFKDMVDIDNTAISFIEKLREKASHCTYLWDCETLPKNSMIFQRYDLYNYLNKICLNGEQISYNDKMDVIDNLFLKQKKVTRKQLCNFFRMKYGNDINITSTNNKELEEINSSLSSEIFFRDIYGDDFKEKFNTIEDIIKEISIFEDKTILYNRLINVYKLSDDKAKIIKGFNAKGFSSLSKELLVELKDKVQDEFGEIIEKNIIDILKETNLSFIEIIYSSKYTFESQIKQHNQIEDKIDYEYIDKLPTSPANKRGIWSTIKLVNEVEHIVGRPIDKFFLECTRHNEKKGERKDSRKKTLETKFESVKKTLNEIDSLSNEEYKELLKQLEGFESERFKQKKLFLYFSQLGKCMYSGETINLNKLFTNEYDIDHIVPRAFLKDDSIDNMVLVKRELNKSKSDIYPIPSSVISPEGKKLWKYLNDCDLISDNKLAKLQRTSELTDEEKASFINRQLVFTNQTVKIVADLLKIRNKNCEVVWSKAENVSSFREKFDIPKCREINDLHHAHDAYLNVVVGNTFNTKYGYKMNAARYKALKEADPEVKQSEKKKFSMNIDLIYKFPVYDMKSDYFAWDPNKTLNEVLKQLSHHDINVTYKPTTDTGAFYDETIYSPNNPKNKIESLIALKQKGMRSDVSKYGGHKSEKPSFFAIIAYTISNKTKHELFAIPIMARNLDERNLIKYIEETKNCQNVSIECNNIMKNTIIKMNNFDYLIRGFDERQIAVQTFWSYEQTKYLKYIVKLSDKKTLNSYDKDEYVIQRTNSEDTSNEKTIIISKEQNLKIYKQIIEKFSKEPFKSSKLNDLSKKLVEKEDSFAKLTLNDQVEILKNILKIQAANPSRGDLSLLGLGNDVGRIQSSALPKGTKIISRSITGYYEHILWESK